MAIEINDNNYVNIQAFMVKELKLKGNELLVYAIIYGFSQTKNQYFTGSIQYLASWTNSTRQGIIKVLKSLQEKKLIVKIEHNTTKTCKYKALTSQQSLLVNKVYQSTKFTSTSKQSLLGESTEFTPTSKQSLPNNIYKLEDNINNNTAVDKIFVSNLQDFEHSSLENLTSKENLTNSSLENLTNSSLEVLDSNKNNRVRIKNNNNNVVDNFSAIEKKEVIPSAVRQEIEMAIRSNNWNITIQKLLMLAEGDYMLVLQQIKHFGEKGLRYTIAAIKGKYEVNEEPVKTAEDEKKERFKEWEHCIYLIQHQYENCKEKIKPEIYEWMGEFLKERGII